MMYRPRCVGKYNDDQRPTRLRSIKELKKYIDGVCGVVVSGKVVVGRFTGQHDFACDSTFEK